MISPDEIKRQALKWWVSLLQSTLSGEVFFPKTIDRIGKIRPGHITQQFETLQEEVATLYRHSKNQTGKGYLVKTIEKHFRRTGTHELPDTIVFETIDDYIGFTGKKKAWQLFLLNSQKLILNIPLLKDWVSLNCTLLTHEQTHWDNILKVVHYFLDNPRPELYIRQLPIAVHTKFIEENVTIIQSMLDFLIPDHIRNYQQKRFAERYFLKYDEPLFRIRILDKTINCFGNHFDISLPLSDYEKLNPPAMNILITENKMNFLTLPNLPSTIAVWSGGGFNISYLKNAGWMPEKHIFYWGDIDEHGFQILHQLRSYFSQARSVMMDRKTFEHFSEFTVVGARNHSEQLLLLNEEERKLFEHLKRADRNRLEQEKISQEYADEYLKRFLQMVSVQGIPENFKER